MFLRFRISRKKIPKPKAARTAIPPTTPPTIAPVLDLDAGVGVGEGEAELDCDADAEVARFVTSVRMPLAVLVPDGV